MFCHGVLVLGAYVLVPAHCVVAARTLSHFHLRHRARSVEINPGAVLVHPEFRLISFDRRDPLYHDIAIFPVTNRTRHSSRHSSSRRRRRRRRIKLPLPTSRPDSAPVKERGKFSLPSQSRSEYSLSPPALCDLTGLPPGQICLTRPGGGEGGDGGPEGGPEGGEGGPEGGAASNASWSSLRSVRQLVGRGEVLEPGQGYYRYRLTPLRLRLRSSH